MKIKLMGTIIICLLFVGAIFHIGGFSKSSHSKEDNATKAQNTNTHKVVSAQNVFTPIVASYVTQPRPVLGSDGKYHLTYELQLTNANAFTWLIKSVEVLNANNQDQVLAVFSDEKVAPNNQIIPGRSPSDKLERGVTSVFFITLSVDSLQDVPKSIAHRITISVPGGIVEGFLNFLGLPADTTELVQIVARRDVSTQEAIVGGPPLRGDNWIAADGCCTSERHVRSIMPVNGKLVISQRFAIDWEKLGDNNRIFEGDPLDVKNYFCYGEYILAVGDGTVVAAVDKFDDQIPGKLPPNMSLEEADGNYVVIDLGGGNFAFYAHMIKGSVAVKVGDTVAKGQVIGLVGNTGNT